MRRDDGRIPGLFATEPRGGRGLSLVPTTHRHHPLFSPQSLELLDVPLPSKDALERHWQPMFPRLERKVRKDSYLYPTALVCPVGTRS